MFRSVGHLQPLYWNTSYHSRIVLPVAGSVCYLVRILLCTVAIDSVLENSKTQNPFLSPALAMFRHDCPPSGESCKYAMATIPKQTWRDSLTIDSPFCCVWLDCCSAESGSSGGTYELLCILHVVDIFPTGQQLRIFPRCWWPSLYTSNLHTGKCLLKINKIKFACEQPIPTRATALEQHQKGQCSSGSSKQQSKQKSRAWPHNPTIIWPLSACVTVRTWKTAGLYHARRGKRVVSFLVSYVSIFSTVRTLFLENVTVTWHFPEHSCPQEWASYTYLTSKESPLQAYIIHTFVVRQWNPTKNISFLQAF
jgi:hypothetical protein